MPCGLDWPCFFIFGVRFASVKSVKGTRDICALRQDMSKKNCRDKRIIITQNKDCYIRRSRTF